jgi:hypothetical protein
MKRTLAAAALALALAGCQPAAVTTTPPERGSDVHIRTPRSNVDIDKGGKVDVDVHPKGPNR